LKSEGALHFPAVLNSCSNPKSACIFGLRLERDVNVSEVFVPQISSRITCTDSTACGYEKYKRGQHWSGDDNCYVNAGYEIANETDDCCAECHR
jgi:hypothetical protein